MIAFRSFCRMIPVRLFILALAAFLLNTAAAAGDAIAYRGLIIQAVAPDPDRTFDVDVMDGGRAVEKIKSALDLIREKSPVHDAILARLKTRGKIYLVYNPNYPARARDLAQVRVALFIPFYPTGGGPEDKTTLPVVISRHGIKWPEAELAAVIVHELVGHGFQYLEGLTDTVRTGELECQAYLHQELAHQAFGLDKSSPEMIRFRQQLSGVGAKNGYCTPFFKYLRRNYPEKLNLVERLDPDVPQLLPLLDEFIQTLEAAGTTQKALAVRREMVETRFRQLEAGGSARELYGTGLYLLEGAGYRQDIKRGARLIRRSAEKNHAAAQIHLAELYRLGRGVPRDPGQAYLWLTIAAGNAEGSEQREILSRRSPLKKELSTASQAALEAKAKAWTPSP